jgi:hypothetical protein
MSYKELQTVDIGHLIEKKGNQDYLSWANAWNELKQVCPTAQRFVYENEQGLPYFTDGRTAMVKVGIIVNDVEHIDYLPIMDYRNNSIPLEKVTTFDIVKTIQRSTVKAIALHGLGLNLWIGEDTKIAKSEPKPKEKTNVKKGDSVWTGKIVPWIERAKTHKTTEEIVSILSNGYIITPTLKKHIENECSK